MDSRETKSSRRASFVGSKRKHDLSGQIKSKRLKFEEKNKSMDKYLRPLECGWKRELVLRCISRGGKTKSADVYYYTPSGKKLRSMPQVVSYLQTNGSDDPSSELSGENFVFYGEVVSHHKNEWVRNARDRKVVSQKKGKTLNPKSQPKPDLDVSRRPVGRPKGSKRGKGTKPGSKLDDVAKVESRETLISASIVKVESNIGPIKVSPKKINDGRNMHGEGSKFVRGLKSTGSVYILPALPPKSSSRLLLSSNSSSLSLAVASAAASSSRRVCNLGCPGLENVLPTLECQRCRCLFHPECVAFLGGPFEVTNFFCECCKYAGRVGNAGRSREPETKLPCKFIKLSNVSTSTYQKHQLIVPATTKVTASSSNLSSLSRSMPEAIHVPVANCSTKFTSNSLSTQLKFTNPASNLTIPFYANNNAYLSNHLPSYFVIPQSPNIYPQNGAFVTQSAINMYQPSVAGQSLLGMGYVTSVNSILPNTSFQASSIAPLVTQSSSNQPLVPFCQTFTLGSHPIASLKTDSAQIQHNGFSSFNVASSESRLSSDPIVRPMVVELTSENKRSKKPKRSYKKSSANISDTSCSNAESSQGNLEDRNPTDETTAENSAVPPPLFVHNKTSAHTESTVSSNGVISKIILPTYDVRRSKNGSELESISAAESVPSLCPVTSTFTKKSAEESGAPDANLAICTLNTFSTSREANYSAGASDIDARVRANTNPTSNPVVEEGLLTQSCTSDEDEDIGNISRSCLDHDYTIRPVTEESSDACDSLQSVPEFQEVKVDVEFDANLSVESETKDADFPKTPPPSLNESINSMIDTPNQVTAEASTQDLDQTSCLIDQVLAKVFRHLTTHELLMASQVCQRWRQVSRSKELWCSLTVTDDLFHNLRKNFHLWKVLAEQKPYLLDLRQMNFGKENLFHFAELLSSSPVEFQAGITTVLMSHCPLNLLRMIGMYLPNLNHLSVVVACNGRDDGGNDGNGRNGDDGEGSVGSCRDSFVKVLTSLKSLKSLQIHLEELDGDTSSSVVDEDPIPDEDEEAEFEPSSVRKVCRFVELKELELLGSSCVNSLGFEKCLFSSIFDKLESVKVGNCLRWDEQMFFLLGNLVNLKTLNLKRGGNIPDLGLSLALAKMKGLHELKLSDYILDWSVSLAIQKLPSLVKLHVRPETSHSGSDKAPYINLCCMSAMWNHKNLQQLTWVTSLGKSGPGPNILLPFQVFDVSKLRGKKGLIDPLDDEEEGTLKDGLLVLSIDDLRSKLQTSLPNTRVDVIAR